MPQTAGGVAPPPIRAGPGVATYTASGRRAVQARPEKPPGRPAEADAAIPRHGAPGNQRDRAIPRGTGRDRPGRRGRTIDTTWPRARRPVAPAPERHGRPVDLRRVGLGDDAEVSSNVACALENILAGGDAKRPVKTWLPLDCLAMSGGPRPTAAPPDRPRAPSGRTGMRVRSSRSGDRSVTGRQRPGATLAVDTARIRAQEDEMPRPRIARLELDSDTRRREKEALRRKTSMDTRTPMVEVARGSPSRSRRSIARVERSGRPGPRRASERETPRSAPAVLTDRVQCRCRPRGPRAQRARGPPRPLVLERRGARAPQATRPKRAAGTAGRRSLSPTTTRSAAALVAQSSSPAPARSSSVEVVVGEEISTRNGHFLGLFLESRIPPGLTALRRDRAHPRPAVAWPPWRTPAHPINVRDRGERCRTAPHRRSSPLDADRERSTTPPPPPGSTTRSRALRNRRAGACRSRGGSDAHDVCAWAAASTRFQGRSADDLKRALSAGEDAGRSAGGDGLRTRRRGTWRSSCAAWRASPPCWRATPASAGGRGGPSPQRRRPSPLGRSRLRGRRATAPAERAPERGLNSANPPRSCRQSR